MGGDGGDTNAARDTGFPIGNRDEGKFFLNATFRILVASLCMRKVHMLPGKR